MHLTRQTDFALRTMIYLASRPAGALVSVREICEQFGLSANHLSKIVNKLANEGFILSRRGRGGGISLGRPAEDIGVGELVRLMEPLNDLVDCTTPRCILLPGCQFKGILAEASQAFIAVFDQYTLADLVDSETQKLIWHDAS
ncbi:Rrf2 family transcriptional regulator [Oceanicoccus sagamiensis]|uniref:BadM/Rrf2 family transcriptional regulator n=1 Tax=Oceanicoccus sagamiensis TaxID=716816 RepID=A0A1X9N8Y5_9GAMM|nr:Rrf2 family transcriptional regulator [Oceanicoccus sagamiensis]ARN73641.1 hypothetical protein BST96_05615 [Oceanicoccus sagamiensis]